MQYMILSFKSDLIKDLLVSLRKFNNFMMHVVCCITFFFQLQMEELYVEILYTILHMIGADVDKSEISPLVDHLKEAFHMDDEKHEQLLDIATMREEPYLKANVEIFEAKRLLGKDMLGSSDPYCTFYLTTNPLARYNTSYKPKTLDPIWNEDFVL